MTADLAIVTGAALVGAALGWVAASFLFALLEWWLDKRKESKNGKG